MWVLVVAVAAQMFSCRVLTDVAPSALFPAPVWRPLLLVEWAADWDKKVRTRELVGI
jgi:hypothetical protein